MRRIRKIENYVDKDLVKYIENNIYPMYSKNDKGHGIKHVMDTKRRCIKFANKVDGVDYSMVYTINAYHDIGHYIDAVNHEKVSSELLLNDKNLKKFFDKNQIVTMADAVYDHRSKIEKEPRTVYGKIMASAEIIASVEEALISTYSYRVEHNESASLERIIEDSREHLMGKFGNKGYAIEKMYFENLEYKQFLKSMVKLVADKDEFKKRFMEVNGLNDKLIFTFEEIKRHNPKMSLDEVLYKVYVEVTDDYKKPFAVLKNEILAKNGINELQYYTKNVNRELKEYIIKKVFPRYDKNDLGHNLLHILEVIRRCFALNDTFKLHLDDNMIFAMASWHDVNKYVDHEIHHLLAAEAFMNDEKMKSFFNDEERTIIKVAIEDHRSSKEDEPRSTYGMLISSADRNTSIEIVFIRSFHVAHERMPESIIEDYLDYTINRLAKRYSEENPENMFYEDVIYKVFLQDMRNLLKDSSEFKRRYCEVNNIIDRNTRVCDNLGISTSNINVIM